MSTTFAHAHSSKISMLSHSNDAFYRKACSVHGWTDSSLRDSNTVAQCGCKLTNSRSSRSLPKKRSFKVSHQLLLPVSKDAPIVSEHD